MDEKGVLKKLVEHQYEMATKTQLVLQEISQTTKSMAEVAKEMKAVNEGVSKTLERNTLQVESLTKFWGRITYILILAIILLAGVRNIGELLGVVK